MHIFNVHNNMKRNKATLAAKSDKDGLKEFLFSIPQFYFCEYS